MNILIFLTVFVTMLTIGFFCYVLDTEDVED